jgi:mannose-6-phosphate isomerase-like protein (cupin superfamily)
MKIEENSIVYAKLYKPFEGNQALIERTDWLGKDTESLQASVMRYNKGKVFKTHQHKMNPRCLNYTQEAFIVIKGSLQVDIYKDKNLKLGTLIANAGDIICVWRGYHRISILENDTVAYELKAGAFTSVELDKEFLDVDDKNTLTLSQSHNDPEAAL